MLHQFGMLSIQMQRKRRTSASRWWLSRTLTPKRLSPSSTLSGCPWTTVPTGQESSRSWAFIYQSSSTSKKILEEGNWTCLTWSKRSLPSSGNYSVMEGLRFPVDFHSRTVSISIHLKSECPNQYLWKIDVINYIALSYWEMFGERGDKICIPSVLGIDKPVAKIQSKDLGCH